MNRSALLGAAAAAVLATAPARAQDPKPAVKERRLKIILGALPERSPTGPGFLPATLDLFDNGKQRFIFVREKGRSELEPGDVIQSFNGRPLESLDQVKSFCEKRQPGASIRLDLIRKAEPTTIQLRLTNVPGPAHLGLAVSARQGFLTVDAVEAGTAAAIAELQPGDVVLGVDGRRLSKPEELSALLKTRRAYQHLALSLLRGGRFRKARVELLEAPRRGYIGIQHQVESGCSRINAILPGTAAEKFGLEVGETIVAVDGQALTPEQPLIKILEETRSGQELTLTLRRP